MAGWLLGVDATRVAERYARHVVPSFFHAWRDEVLHRLDLRPGLRVLDVACSTGSVTLGAARRVGARGEVWGVDASPAMLAVAARDAATLERDASPVRLRLGDAHDLPFPDGWFDRVACPHGLMFFDEPERALAELARVLRPGGTLVATTWGRRERAPHEALLADAFRRVLGTEPPFFRLLFSCGPRARLRRLAARAGLAASSRVDVVVGAARFRDEDAYWEGMVHGRPLDDLVRGLNPGPLRALRAASDEALRPHRCGAGFAFPMEGLALTYRKPSPAGGRA